MSQRHKDLCKQIDELNKQYYVYNESKVPDAVFDQLFRELKDIEAADPSLVTPLSPTQRIGYMAARHFTKATHPFPMLSLGNAFNASELMDWIKTISGTPKADIIGELKLDGASLELIYIEGKLNQAITRGDGVVGEDVTLNALGIDGVVHSLVGSFGHPVVIRGEVVVKKTVFDSVNAELSAAGKDTYVNQRNYASGALRQKDPQITKQRQLTFISYSVDFILPEEDPRHLTTIGKARQFAQDQGFYISPHHSQSVTTSLEGWTEFLDSQERIRTSGLWDYDIDGLVFKVDSRVERLVMGFNSREPKWAIAYKFPASEGLSVLKGVTIQVGRTGQLTPVAEIEPVFIHGTTISRVTLHNIDEIHRLAIGIGSEIVVKRAGDVIPKIVSGVGETPPEKRYVFPTRCPCCDSCTTTVIGVAGSRTIFCSDPDCPDRVKMHLYHCAGRGVYNIMGMGIETINGLYDKCGFKSIKDHIRLLLLTKDELLLTGLSDKQADKLLINVTKAKEITLERLISSFGIDGISDGSGERLAAHFGTLDNLINASVEELMQGQKVGPVTSANIHKFFTAYKSDNFYPSLIAQLTITNPEPRSKLMEGKSVMITGSVFGKMSRKQLTAYYKTLSASVTSSVTSSTHLALFGTKYTGHKLETAKQLGTPYKIFDETGVIEDTTALANNAITKQG